MAHVRERPPLRLSYCVKTPAGRFYRWGDDESDPANVPSGVKFSDTQPGGFEQFDAALPRKSGIEYGDLDRLSTVRAEGAGGECAWEGRLEKTPRQSGSELAVMPGCVGWQAHLTDDDTAREIYVDRDMSRWQSPSVQRKLNLTATYKLHDHSVDADATTGQPSLNSGVDGPWGTTPANPASEAFYDAGVPIGSLYYAWKRGTNTDNSDTNWNWYAYLSTDDIFTSQENTGNLRAAGPGTGTLTATTATREWAAVQFYYANVANAATSEYDLFWTVLAVYGTHGLTKQGTASATSAQGLFASDVIANALSRWAPLLSYTTGANGTIKPSSFVIPHLAFLDPTTVAEMIKEANRFHLKDWAVWEGPRIANPTFYYHDRGDRGKSWRARIAPSELEETGQSVERLWNGVIVQFRDVDGTTKTVGPTGSTATTTSDSLIDTDPENPANQLGIRRYKRLDMGIVSTTAGATEVGRRFLVETKALDRSGKAKIVGHVQDDHGTWYPYHKVRAGDTISFVDAADTSERRIVKTEKDVDSRTCSLDLDAPPEGMQALLERLGVVLVELGL